MKTQPDYVAYTCTRCGAIAVVSAGEPSAEIALWAGSAGSAEDALSSATARCSDGRN